MLIIPSVLEMLMVILTFPGHVLLVRLGPHPVAGGRNAPRVRQPARGDLRRMGLPASAGRSQLRLDATGRVVAGIQ